MASDIAAPLASAPSYVVYDCCRDAVRGVLAREKWGGDVSKVRFDQTFDGDYGYSENDMLPFIYKVNVALNQLLLAHNCKPVVLLATPDLLDPSSTVGDFIDAVYAQASAQQ